MPESEQSTPFPSASCNRRLPRRDFLATSAAIAATAAVTGTGAAESPPVRNPPDLPPLEIRTSVKWGMIGIKGSVLEKFQLQKELGYDGMELNSPTDVDLDEAVAASEETGMPIHGVVDSVHWNLRLSSPDANVRQKGLNALLQGLRDTKKLRGDSVLLVPGRVGKDESHDEVWNRSIVEIRKAIPWAARLGVRILIENVWNGFCETPESLCKYLDEIDSPWVGSYFDIGNVRKFGESEVWIRALGSRIVKLDVKDWGAKNGFCKIGDGDVNWPEVRKALREINFTGWCTAEVGGGGKERLADIQARMLENLLGA